MANNNSNQICRVKDAFLDGKKIWPGGISQSLVRSWERTVNAGIRRTDRLLFGSPVSAQEAKQIRADNEAFIGAASQDLSDLGASLGISDWVVLLTDAQGTILDSTSKIRTSGHRAVDPLGAGRRLPESSIGTTAPGMVINDLKPVTVQRHEHFLDELQHLSCVAAPIFGLNGQLMGVLDVTAHDSPLDARTWQRVNMTAMSIENRVFESSAIGQVFAVHEDQRMLGTPFQGLLAALEDGRITAANTMARQILGFSLQTNEPQFLSDLFDTSLPVSHKVRGKIGTVEQIQTHGGGRLFIRDIPREGRCPISLKSAAPVAASGTSDLDPLLERGRKVFAKGISVLLQGETGTGKEWFARRLHDMCRPGKPFVAINCSAITESLAEAELFGYEDGAYTGGRKGGARGKIESAHGGTLFLDEIGDMPIGLQTRLLRVLQERVNLRIGGHNEVPVDILVVAATHQDLPAMVDARLFREDLFYRINGLCINLPVVRQRTDKHALVCAVLAQAYGWDSVSAPMRRSATFQALVNFDWPGNVRQLINVVRVGKALSDSDGLFDYHYLPDEILSSRQPASKPDFLEEGGGETLPVLKENWVNKALQDHKGNVTATAKALGVSRTTLYKYIRR